MAYLDLDKVHKIKFTKYPDVLVLAMPVTAAMVRLGIFLIRIGGTPTDGTSA